MRRWKAAAFLCVKIVIGGVFFLTGILHISGVSTLAKQLHDLEIGPELPWTIGLLEIAGAVAVLLPGLSSLGAVLLCFTMCGTIAMHLFAIGGSLAFEITLLILSATIAFVHRDQIDSFLDALDDETQTGSD